jgi:hypothetical protein
MSFARVMGSDWIAVGVSNLSASGATLTVDIATGNFADPQAADG